MESRLAVAETTELPSYRRAEVTRLAAEEGGLRVWLREGNTFTSTLYRRNPDDSFFLFFTDDVLAIRPLLGAANLAVALGGGLPGLATLPVDHGDRRSPAPGRAVQPPRARLREHPHGSFVLPKPRAQNG